MKIFIFDTETSGLPKRNNKINKINNKINSDNWPYIVQLSFILFDSNKNIILEKFNSYVKLTDCINIDPESEKIHKISKEFCIKYGNDINFVLNKFKENLENSDLIVGHNLNFDKTMILVEAERNNFDIKFKKDLNEFCTMENSVNLCKLPFKNKLKIEKNYKFPKLEELIFYLFGEKLDNLHNSWNDIIFTFRAYYQMEFKEDIFKKGLLNNEIIN